MIERVDCDQDGEEYETPHGSYVRFSDHQRVMAEAAFLMRAMLEGMDQLAGYGDEETDGAIYRTVHKWEKRVQAFLEKVSPEG